MKVFDPRKHAFFDYILVLIFLLIPSFFGWTGLPAIAAYIFAGIHLIFTLTTAFSLAPLKIIPFHVHGLYEFIVSGLLIILTWPLGFSDPSVRNVFYIGGVTMFIIWLLTDYHNETAMRGGG